MTLLCCAAGKGAEQLLGELISHGLVATPPPRLSSVSTWLSRGGFHPTSSDPLGLRGYSQGWGKSTFPSSTHERMSSAHS